MKYMLKASNGWRSNARPPGTTLGFGWLCRGSTGRLGSSQGSAKRSLSRRSGSNQEPSSENPFASVSGSHRKNQDEHPDEGKVGQRFWPLNDDLQENYSSKTASLPHVFQYYGTWTKKRREASRAQRKHPGDRPLVATTPHVQSMTQHNEPSKVELESL